MSRKTDNTLKIDKIIHEPARLRLATILRHAEEAEFSFLRHETGLTNGNLVSHLRKLEEAGYLSVRKFFKGRRPCTAYRLNKLGLKKYDEYRKNIKRLMLES